MRYLFLCLFLFCWITTAAAAPNYSRKELEKPDNPTQTTTPVPKELTLRDAIMLSLRYHPNVRNAEIDRVTQKYALEVAKSVFDVQYAINGSLNSVAGTGTTKNITPGATLKTPIGTQISVTGTAQWSETSGTQRGGNVSITQPLISGFGTDVTLAPLRNAYDQERINKLNFKLAIMTKVTAVIQAYVTVVRNENSLITQELTLKDSLARLEQDRKRVDAGRMARADLVAVEANFARQQVSILSAKTTLEQSRLALLTEIGLDPNTQISISKEVRLPNEEIPGLKKSTELILKNDIPYQIQIVNQNVYERQVLLARDALRPQLNLTAGDGTGAGPGAVNQNVGLSFSYPIDSSQVLKQALLIAQTTLKKAIIALKYRKWFLESDVLNRLRTLENQRQQVTTSNLSRDLAKHSLNIAEKKLQYGRATTFETTTLRNQYITADLTAINAKNDYISGIANLQQALGTTLAVWKIEVRY